MGPGRQVIRSWIHHCVGALSAAKAEIDALNVFPVPDGDTGTNVWLTMDAARAEVDAQIAEGGSLADVAQGLARGALMGARGNSGVIMSQILRGVSEAFVGRDGLSEIQGADLSAMLRRGETLAYAAVAQPVEGTILTVARAAADAAEIASRAGGDAVTTAQQAAKAAHEALARTPDLLPMLRDAGVVDAGGRSLTVVLDALVAAVTGRDVISPPQYAASNLPSHAPMRDYRGPAFEVMYLLDAETGAIAELREALAALGDSLVIVGDEALWNVHVHVDDPGAAIEAALAVGRPHRIRISHLRFVDEPTHDGRRVIAVTHGAGTAKMLVANNVVCVPAFAKQPPATSAIIEAITQVGSDEIILLPSDSDVRAVCDLAAEQARQRGTRVSVIPTRSIVQTLAAVAVHDPLMRFDDDVVAMARAASATRYGAITTATKNALTMAGECRVGDTLGLLEGDIACISPEWHTAAQELLRVMLGTGGEIITLVFGEEAGAEFRFDIEQWATAHAPFADVVAIAGGQPRWPLIIGVE